MIMITISSDASRLHKLNFDRTIKCVLSRTEHSTPDRAVRVRALAGDIMLCSWARHLNLTMPLSTQEYKWVPANCWGNLTNNGRVTCDGLASRPGGVEILLVVISSGSHEPVGFKALLYLALSQRSCA